MDKRLILSCENVMKIYKSSELEIAALQGLDLRVMQGEMVAVIGSSGSGKSTLLNILGGLDSPSAGKVVVDGMDLGKMTASERERYKRETVGFIWQHHTRNFIPYLSALENIELVMKLRGRKDTPAARALLDAVGLADKAESKLKQLSGGEQQRVAIAIGISGNPKILLADEPTGAVDSATASELMGAFRRLQQESGLTIIIVTHDTKLAAKVDRVVRICDGRTSSEYIRKTDQSSMDDMLVEFGKQSHNEYTVLDSVGRLQIPVELLERAGLTGTSKVSLSFENGKIVISPIETV